VVTKKSIQLRDHRMILREGTSVELTQSSFYLSTCAAFSFMTYSSCWRFAHGQAPDLPEPHAQIAGAPDVAQAANQMTFGMFQKYVWPAFRRYL
jgi:hypothetical protein